MGMPTKIQCLRSFRLNTLPIKTPINTALFIGRFQPFHLGHLSVVEAALKENDFLIIGIGSSENHHTLENPFTVEERIEMIEAALNEKQIPSEYYTLIPIPDINDNDQWVEHVKRLVPAFKQIYTGSPIVKKLFAPHKGHDVVDVTFKEKINATSIRKSILKNEQWENYVAKSVATILKKINAPERLKKI